MKTCIHTLGILAIASSLSFAQDDQKPPEAPPKRPAPEERFKRLDKDANGTVSLEEFKASPMGQRNVERAAEIFKKIDADSNGELTLEEFKAHRPDRHRRGPRGPKGPGAPPEAPPEGPPAE